MDSRRFVVIAAATLTAMAVLLASVYSHGAAPRKNPIDPFHFFVDLSLGHSNAGQQEDGPVQAETATATSWSMTSGGTNFQIIGIAFSPAAAGQVRLMYAGPSYLYASEITVPVASWGQQAIPGLTVGVQYTIQIRAYTGTEGYEELPWVQYGIPWVQPSKNDAPIEQDG